MSRICEERNLRSLVAALLASLVASGFLANTAAAIPELLEIQVGIDDGSGMAMISGIDLEAASTSTTIDESTGTITFVDGEISGTNWTLQWSELAVNADPFVNFVGGFTNLLPVATDFTLSTVTPIAPVLPSSVYGGQTIVTFQDANFSGDGFLSNNLAGDPGFSGTIDGASVLEMLDEFAISAPCFPCEASEQQGLAADGITPTLPGPSVNFSIGITHRLRLSSGDTATFNSRFIVEPVPEPGVALLLGTAFVVFGRASRKGSRRGSR